MRSFSKFEVPKSVVGYCDYSQRLQILGPSATAQLRFVSEIWSFSVILKILNEIRFRKNSQNCMIFQFLI